MTLDDIQAKVGALQASVDVAIAKIGELKAGQVDPAKVQAIGDALDAAKAGLDTATA